MARDLRNVIKSAARELPDISDSSFGSYFDQARAAITQRLISEHGFNTVCIEGDWPDARRIDHYTRLHPRPSSGSDVHTMRVFDHFPLWMWRNTETQAFVDWLREHNARLPMHQRTSFNGLDLYSMGASMRAVVEYLDRADPALAKAARRRYGRLERWLDDPSEYGLATLRSSSASCEASVVRMLQDLLSARLDLATRPSTNESFLDAEMNARVVRDAEAYYRALYHADRSSWNLRDTHMFAVLSRLLKLRPGSKAVVWAHNSHVGDAQASVSASRRGEVNLGQLCREGFPTTGEVSIIGCGTHTGTVAAADEWDSEMRVIPVTPSRADSYERVFHDVGIPSFVVSLPLQQHASSPSPSVSPSRIENKGENEDKGEDERGNEMPAPRLLQRFIGVVYRPDTERQSHYVECVLPHQYDAFVWFDRTEALRPFETAQPKEPLAMGETYPFGL
ncbi:erythromycin esterase-domain-containing protein [Nemania sp. FL0031]|nr:erythromycin esterase-domain-containing protein [Nemania sp. FL0031]